MKLPKLKNIVTKKTTQYTKNTKMKLKPQATPQEHNVKKTIPYTQRTH